MAELYTLEEVKKHNGKDSDRTWIVIHDIVYDPTDYMKDVRKNVLNEHKRKMLIKKLLCF